MGKKKKSVANKLAKMSDEERARYLQHKADLEEEARRRKDQLISTFMKNKIRKEDAFSRLNLAKINQHWHQVLRRSKCMEMKENVDHMRKWIDRIISLKNRTIEKLMEELEEAESQYSHNLKYHIIWIDKIIDSQNTYLKKLNNDYDEEFVQTLDSLTTEQEEYAKKGEEERNHLKTIIYGQDVKAHADAKRISKHYDETYDNVVCEKRTILENAVKECETTLSTLWKQVAEVVRDYVRYTDGKRAHLAELRWLDSESSAEIARNQESISIKEQQIAMLNNEYVTTVARGEQLIKSLEEEVGIYTIQFSEMRHQLQVELVKDERNLRHMTDASNSCIQFLEGINHKGCQLMILIETCEKLETERDKVIKYLPLSSEAEELELSQVLKTDSEREYTTGTPSEDGKTSKTLSEKLVESREISPTLKDMSPKLDPEPNISSKIRPKTTLMRRLYDRSLRCKQLEAKDSETEKSKLTALKKIEIREKKMSSSTSTSASSDGVSCHSNISSYDNNEKLSTCFEGFRHMEKFWRAYNKAELDTMELKAEKKVLMAENKQLRGMMRAVLEAAALAQSIPNSKVSTRVASRSRTSRSAPPRRLII